MKIFRLVFVQLLILICIPAFNQWQATNGPTGGMVNEMTAFNGNIYAATGYFGPGALYSSSNNGESWQFVNAGLPVDAKYTSVTSNENYIFLGVWLNGIYRSSDGENWTLMNEGISPSGTSVQALFTKGDTIYASSFQDGMYFSADNGNNWELRSNGLEGAAKRIADFTRLENILFASTPLGIYKTLDEGMNWQISSTGITFDKRYSYTIHQHQGILYAGSIAGLYRSENSGESWSLTGSGIISGAIQDIQSRGDSIFVTTEGKLFISVDQGNSWEEFSAGLPEVGGLQCLHTAEGLLLGGTVIHGTYAFDFNQNMWEVSNKGINNVSVWDLTKANDKLFAVTNDADFGLVFQSVNNGEDWMVSNDGGTIVGYSSLLFNDSLLLAGSNGMHLFRSADTGSNWQKVDVTEFPASYVGDLAATDNAVFGSGIGFSIDVYRSFDHGLTFEPTNVPGQGDIHALHSFDGYVFAGRSDGIYRSADDGDSWTFVSESLGDFPFVSSISSDGEYLYANSNSGTIYRSGDYGEVWQEVYSAGFQNRIIKIYANTSYVFLGSTNEGIYYSTDHGNNWQTFNDNLPSGPGGLFPYIASLEIKGDSIYMGTAGYGVWVSPLPLITSANEQTLISSGKELSLKVTPNPVKDNAEISFYLSQPTKGKLRILDIHGKAIHILANKNFNIGVNVIPFQNEYPAGVYFLELKTNRQTAVIKMVL